MTDQPAPPPPPTGEDRLRRAGKATRTVAMLVIALAVAVLAASTFYTTWLEDDPPTPEPAADYTQDLAMWACLEFAYTEWDPSGKEFRDLIIDMRYDATEVCGALYPDAHELWIQTEQDFYASETE